MKNKTYSMFGEQYDNESTGFKFAAGVAFAVMVVLLSLVISFWSAAVIYWLEPFGLAYWDAYRLSLLGTYLTLGTAIVQTRQTSYLTRILNRL